MIHDGQSDSKVSRKVRHPFVVTASSAVIVHYVSIADGREPLNSMLTWAGWIITVGRSVISSIFCFCCDCPLRIDCVRQGAAEFDANMGWMDNHGRSLRAFFATI